MMEQEIESSTCEHDEEGLFAEKLNEEELLTVAGGGWGGITLGVLAGGGVGTGVGVGVKKATGSEDTGAGVGTLTGLGSAYGLGYAGGTLQDKIKANRLGQAAEISLSKVRK